MTPQPVLHCGGIMFLLCLSRLLSRFLFVPLSVYPVFHPMPNIFCFVWNEWISMKFAGGNYYCEQIKLLHFG